jgi:Helix-turn-helix domain
MSSNAADAPSALQFAHALAHPLRWRLYHEYHREPTSPSRVARRLDARLNIVSYHTHVLLSHGCIELVDSRRVRGTVERFYRATQDPIVEDDEWETLPMRLRRALIHGTLSMTWTEVGRAALNEGFDRAHTHMSRTPLELDGEGRDELNALLRGVMNDALRIQNESTQRGSSPTFPVELVMLHFGRTSPP